MHRYTDGGLRNVWLANGYQAKLTPMNVHTLHVAGFPQERRHNPRSLSDCPMR